MLVSGGLEEADYQRIRLEMWEANRRSVFTFSALATVMFSAMTLLSFLLRSLERMHLYMRCARW